MPDLKVIEGGNTFECCPDFADAEAEEKIVLTETGYCVVLDEEIILENLHYCPWCSRTLPQPKVPVW